MKDSTAAILMQLGIVLMLFGSISILGTQSEAFIGLGTFLFGTVIGEYYPVGDKDE